MDPEMVSEMPKLSHPRNRDLWFSLFFVLLAGLSFLSLWHPELLGLGRLGSLSEHSVGEVSRKEGQVRRKENGSVVWHDLVSTHAKVSIGDVVFTGDDGLAEVKLKSGLHLELAPGSLVVIGDSVGASGPDHWFDFLKMEKNQTPVMRLSRGAMKIHPIEANRPIVIEIPSGSSSSPSLRYRLDPLQGNGEVHVQVREDPTSQKRLQITAEAGAQVRVTETLTPHSASGNPGGTDVPADSPASVVAQSAPVPRKLPALSISPVTVSTRVRDPKLLSALPVTLQWDGIPGATYDLTIFHGDRVLSQTKDIQTRQYHFSLTELDESPYFYQLTAKVPPVASGGEPIQIQSEKMEVGFEFSSPEVKILTRRLRRGTQELITWSRTALTERYMIEISEEAGFAHLIYSGETPINFLVSPTRDPGTFFVRVKGLAKAHESPWSQTVYFIVK